MSAANQTSSDGDWAGSGASTARQVIFQKETVPVPTSPSPEQTALSSRLLLTNASKHQAISKMEPPSILVKNTNKSGISSQ